MSLLTRHPTILIGASVAFAGGTPELVAEDVATAETGWDSLTQTWAVRRASLTAEELAAAYPIGTRLTGRNWWLTGAKPGQRRNGFWIFELSFKGWAVSKPVKIVWGSVADQQSAQNIEGPVSGGGTAIYPRVQVNESAPGFTASYLVNPVDSTTTPALKVGRTNVRSGAPPVPDTIWDYLTESVFHYPNGWVLMDLQADILAGTSAGLITEAYKYIREFTP